jgi:class 3 adenylate cyclase
MVILAFLMKFKRLPGATPLFAIAVTAIVGFSLSYTIDRVRNQQRKVLQLSTIILFTCFPTLMFGFLFNSLDLPGSSELYGLGTIIFAVYFVFFSTASEGRKLQLRRDRQLAAVLFTDIIGFTKLMGDDENNALSILGINRKIQMGIIRKHRGKWLKEIGDGSLVIFYTATEAVQAALEIQEKVQEVKKFEIRMGIHLSEIVITDSDVFGDGVNVASRISDKASAGEITISDSVYQNIRNRENLTITSLGEMEFKNVAYRLGIHKIETSRIREN